MIEYVIPDGDGYRVVEVRNDDDHGPDRGPDAPESPLVPSTMTHKTRRGVQDTLAIAA